MEREEAINRIKDMRSHMLFSEDREALETLIPELRENESEDERIRKTLVKYFKRFNQEDMWNYEVSLKDIVEYLEKQKEEQKPAEWSEEDERMLSRCIKSVECSKQFADSETYKAAKDVEMNWLKSLPERFVLQPKQEWSEEDEEMLEEIINHIDTTSVQRIPARPGSAIGKSWIKFLKSLRLQPKQEWSEEDKDMLNSCISSIEEAKENRYAYKETDGDTSYDYEIAWLKSLRPSWKPSEEQMSALRAAFTVGNLWNIPWAYSSLKELYEQLKRL